MLSKKAQAGLEYMVTYGWAMVTIATIAGVLFFVLSPAIEAENCSGLDKLLYFEHAVSSDGGLVMILQNKSGGRISNVSVSLAGDFSGAGEVPQTSFSSGEKFTLTGETGLDAGQTYTGIVRITYDSQQGLNHIEEATCVGKTEGTGLALSEVTLLPTVALGYQDEGTGCAAEQDHLSLVQSLDSQWAVDPSTCGGINYNYYATGSSSTYFDAIALKFDVGAYTPDAYDGALRFYIRDGGYSSGWHHYNVYDVFKDNSECYDVGPPCSGSPSFANGYEGWIEQSIDDSIWDDGELSLRIWDARVDKVELKLSRGG